MQYWPASTLLQVPEESRQILYNSGVYMVNDVFLPLYETRAFRKDLFGGRGSGKSHHVSDYVDWLLETKKYCRVLFLRFISEDIKDSLWKDFNDRLEERGRKECYRLVDNEKRAFNRRTGNQLVSKGVKSSKAQTAKLKSIAGFTHVVIEEADEIPIEDKRKLIDSVRKKGVEIEIIQSWNTARKMHHIYEEYDFMPSAYPGYYYAKPKEGTGILAVHTNYVDNIHNLNEKFIERYDAAKSGTDLNYYLTDVLGLIPSDAGNLILGHFKRIEAMPTDCERYIWGVDYGYTNDPTAIVKVGCKGRKRYFQELCYEPGLSAKHIKQLLDNYGRKSSETLYSEIDKEMILQLRKLGVTVQQAKKGPGSRIAGISKLKEYECFYIGENYHTEVMNYKYVTATDQLTGKTILTNEPMDGNDHLVNASQYAVYTDSFIHKDGY